MYAPPSTVSNWFSGFDPGVDSSKETFLNVEIFEMLGSNSLVIVDLTEVRPNCLLELGVALGLGKKTIITAIEGTQLPFDAEALPCHFWRVGQPNKVRREAFEKFVVRNINRRGVSQD